MSGVVYTPIEGERTLVQKATYELTNYRYVQYDRGSRATVSIPFHMMREYRVTGEKALVRLVNGIASLFGPVPTRREIGRARAAGEFLRLTIRQARELCSLSGIPFVHRSYPYARWAVVGYHREFARRFYETYAWVRDEAVETYWPEAYVLTDYRLYIHDRSRDEDVLIPLHTIKKYESKLHRLKLSTKIGKFDLRGKVPSEDHIERVLEKRAWSRLPKERLDWLTMTYDELARRHPLPEVGEEEPAPPERGRGVVLRPTIKTRCEYCGAPMNYENIDWVGPDQYACTACGTTYNVEYRRIR